MQTPFAFAGFTFPRTVAMLPKGALAARVIARRNRLTGPYTAAPSPNAKGAFFYLDSDFMPGLRWAWADETDARIEHRGWFSDTHGDGDTIRGIVFRLPKDRGFLAGWSMGESMASELETSRVYDDERSAAYAADSMAEGVAEKERERSAAYSAGSRFADLGEEIKAARRDALAILQDRKGASGSATLCGVIRDKVESLVAAIADAREARARLAEGDGESDSDGWNQFWSGDGALRAAFNEGAGASILSVA